MSSSQLSIIVNSPLFQNLMSGMQRELDSRAFNVCDSMREFAPEATKVIVGVMKSPIATDAARLSAAKTILAISGAPVHGQNNTYQTQINIGSFEDRMSEEDDLAILEAEIVKPESITLASILQ
jgi:hypothetical protein